MKKWDWILLCCAIGTALLLLLSESVFRTDGTYAVVSVDGTEAARYMLSEEKNELIQGVEGGYVRLVIHDGRADVTEASCPDHLCVHQAKISKAGEMIVCLPNKVVIRVVGGEEASVDAMTR